MSETPSRALQPWQVIAGGVCGLMLTLGLARFAYTPLLPVMQLQTGLGDAAAGALAAVNYAGYMSGALAVAWLDDVRWRHRFYSMGLWLALVVTAAMGLSAWWPAWALWRYIGGLCGASGMLLGSGLVLGWLMQHGRRPELGLHFMGIGLGIILSAVGAWALGRLWPAWDAQWWAFAVLGLVFFVPAWRWRPPVPPAPAPKAEGAADAAVPRRWLWTMLASYFAAGWGFVISATFTVAIVEREPALAGQGPWAWALVGLAATPAVFLWDRIARVLGDIRALMLAFVLQILAVMLPAASSALWAALILGLINTIVKPILTLLTLPLTIVTLGLFYFLLTGLMFYWAGSVVDGFAVQGFWWAVLASLLYSVIVSFLNAVLLTQPVRIERL